MVAKLNYKNFLTACIFTTLAAAILFYYSFTIGKDNFFLLLNNNYGSVADIFFTIITFFGDGVIWAFLLLLFVKYRKKLIVLLVSAFILSTLFVQVSKYFIVPNELRPIRSIANTSSIHVVKGMEPHETSSFPSGHTTSAFCYFLIACLVINKKWILPVVFLFALLVGYSRVYLAQHFPLDVAAGMLVAIASVSFAILVQKHWSNRKSAN